MRKFGVLLAALIMGAITLLVPAQSAQAGTFCVNPLCGEVANRLPSGAYVAVIRNWCGDASTLNQNNPPCAGSQPAYIASGTTTNPDQDWDGFRIEIGCTVSYQIWQVVGGWQSTKTASAGSVHKWIKISNDQTAYIRSRSC